MPHLPRASRRAAVTLLTVAITGLTALQAGSASAAPTSADSVPTAAARAAGVRPGDASMGWRTRQATVSGPQLAAGTAATKAKPFVPKGVLGIDVSSWQRNVNWAKQAAAGKRFAYIKATEGTGYKNPYFGAQYTGSAQAGLLRGAYHFATPSSSSGRKQARVFVANGGGWSADGATLPGVLDIEYNPYRGGTCYGLTKKQMVSWVRSFTTEYKRLTTRDAVIYTTTDWWTRCTGNSKAFSTTNPLWLARYATAPGTLPGGWQWATFWQYSNSPIDQNRFSSSFTRLRVLATNAA